MKYDKTVKNKSPTGIITLRRRLLSLDLINETIEKITSPNARANKLAREKVRIMAVRKTKNNNNLNTLLSKSLSFEKPSETNMMNTAGKR